jgi:hypothetical protein
MPIIFTEGLTPDFPAESFDTELQHIKSLFTELNGNTAYVNKLQVPVTNLITKVDSRGSEIIAVSSAIQSDITILTAYAVITPPFDPPTVPFTEPDSNLPVGWDTANFTEADINNVIAALSSLRNICDTIVPPTFSDLKDEIQTVDVENFKLHMDLMSGVRETAPPGINKPNNITLLGLVRALTDIENRFGITYVNYLVLAFETLFLGDLTITNAQTHFDTDPFNNVSYSSLNVVSRVEADPFTETPAAIITDINAIASSLTTWNTTAATHRPIFQQHVIDDIVEYDSLTEKLARYVSAYSISAYIEDPYYRFMFTDVFGSQTVIDIATQLANGEIT